MKLCFIGSGVEREATRLHGIEIGAIARELRDHFDTLVFGGSSEGLMGAFATAFAAHGGKVIGVVPRWLEEIGQVFAGGEIVRCKDLAERKKLMFEGIDAVLCYPGGLGTWDEMFEILADRSIASEVHGKPPCPPIYLYSWEKYYAPLLLQIETAVEVGLVRPESAAKIRSFESVSALTALLQQAR